MSLQKQKGGGNMRSTAERRQMILQTLCERRSELAENLALEFDVSIRTIYYDIEFLAYSYPIYTTKGTGGGIHVMDGFYLGMKYLTERQCMVLENLSKRLLDEERKTILDILHTYRKPQKKEGRENGRNKKRGSLNGKGA